MMNNDVIINDPVSTTSPLIFTGTFSSLKPSLSIETLRALETNGFRQLTPVQSSTIPHFLSHKDVVVEAITGSGKTLAFLVPVIEILKRRDIPLELDQVGAIIISPTRELSKQIYDVLIKLTNAMEDDEARLSIQLVSGNQKYGSDVDKISKKGCNIMIGTPGRIKSLLEDVKVPIEVKELEVLVLDEADRLLEMGFKDPLQAIISKLPKQRRTALFSATMTDELGLLVAAGLRNPIKVVVKVENLITNEVQRTPSSLSIQYCVIEPEHKLSHLVEFLMDKKMLKTIVYFATCYCVDYFAMIFNHLPTLKDFKVYELHRRVELNKRMKIYDEFKTSSSGLLFCTDIAARGLDIQGIDWVIQFDAPQDPKSFIHRCGRAGRLGSIGHALFYLSPNEDAYLEFLKVRKVVFSKFEGQFSIKNIEETCKIENSQSSILHDKSIRAFVSYIRFYHEHKAKYIFNMNKLDLSSTVKLFGLIKLPIMPELKNRSIDFTPLEAKFETTTATTSTTALGEQKEKTHNHKGQSKPKKNRKK